MELGTPWPLERQAAHQGPRAVPCSLPLWVESCTECSLVTARSLLDLRTELHAAQNFCVSYRLQSIELCF